MGSRKIDKKKKMFPGNKTNKAIHLLLADFMNNSAKDRFHSTEKYSKEIKNLQIYRFVQKK